MKRRYTTFLTCASAALACVFLLCLVLRLDRVDFRIPFNYLRDANVFLARAKGIVEGNWIWSNPRVGMPFGADFHDFPLNITLDSALMWVIARFTSSPALIVNLEWIIAIAVTAALGAYALLRLGFAARIAAAAGIIFALLPYTFFRGINHLHCLYYAVPLVSAAAIQIVRGKTPAIYCWSACVIAGLSYAYTAFFAVFVLAAAAVIALIGRRDVRSFAMGAALAGVVAITTLADLSPSLLYRARNGANASMLFKSPAEAQLYGLKLRYLVTPVPGHPLFGVAEEKLQAAKYPLFENENEWGRLGIMGSIGFIFLMLYAVGALVNAKWRALESSDLLGPAAALTLACILLASVGGFGDFVNTFLTPDIRCYTRILPFIGFFSITAAAVLASSLPRKSGIVVLPLITVLAAYDQAVPSKALDQHAADYRNDAEFVRNIETVLPPDSAVFELPYTDFPNEITPARLVSNDLLRPYLHSSKYRWSWPAVSGTVSAEWNRQAAALPVPQMLDALVHRGFSGLWLDTAGYEPGKSPRQDLTRELGQEPVQSPGGRFLFYDLRRYVKSENTPVQATWERGFYYEERDGSRAWRWSLRRGRITLFNPLPQPRTITLSMHVETADQKPHAVRVGRDRVTTPATYRATLSLPPSGSAALDISCDCPGIRPRGSPRVLYFHVSGFTVVGSWLL